MRFIDYGKNGYKCLSDNGIVLFEEDSSHHLIFEFITKDLTAVPALFDKYVRCRLDLETLEVRKDLSGNKYIDQIKEILEAVHPYYQHAFKKECIYYIGNFYNRLLLHHCIHKRTFERDQTALEEWYLGRLNWLMKPFLMKGDSYPTKFYFKYREEIGDNDYYGDTPKSEFGRLVFGVPEELPRIFLDMIMMQKAIRQFFCFVMDITTPNLSSLMTFQRIWLFKNIFYDEFYRLNSRAERYLSLIPNLQFEYIGDDYDTTYSKLCSISIEQMESDEMSKEQKDALCRAVNLAKEKQNAEAEMIYGEYNITSLNQILNIELMSMLQDETMIRPCKNCGKYFIVTNRNTAYCDRIDESGKRCSAVGPSREFQKKMKEDEALKIYTRAYKTHFARVKKGTMEKDAFTEWCKEAKERLEQARAGKLDVPTFQEWLKK